MYVVGGLRRGEKERSSSDGARTVKALIEIYIGVDHTMRHSLWPIRIALHVLSVINLLSLENSEALELPSLTR